MERLGICLDLHGLSQSLGATIRRKVFKGCIDIKLILCYSCMYRTKSSKLSFSDVNRLTEKLQRSAYLSSAFNFDAVKCSSHPTSISTLTPPSNSSKDCEAGDED